MSFTTTLALLSLGALLPAPTASQAGNAILPLFVNSRVQTATEEACPSNEVQPQIIQEVRTLLRDNIICLAVPTQAIPAASCSAISTSCPSGYYWIRSSNGSAVQVYCAMDRVCGCSNTGGWARVAYLNTTDTSQQCPGNWTLMTTPRVCGRTTNAASCDSAIFPTHGIEYSHVCGRVIGYQNLSPDAFDTSRRNSFSQMIDSYYLDGVSITHGDSGSQQHIWSFAAGYGSEVTRIDCPCNMSRVGTSGFVPSYVGDDFFCETGNDNRTVWPHELFFDNDPLWDGQGCGTNYTCECTFNNPPWFCKQLPQPTTDDIEVHICGDEPPDNEDTPVELIELYTR